MDFIKILREDNDLSDLLCNVCDIQILPEFKTPQDESGHLTYNISGKTFARTGSGSEYILLEDGTIGFWGSEGACGRIADNLQDFFEFMISCPYWQDYLDEYEYQNQDALGEFAKGRPYILVSDHIHSMFLFRQNLPSFSSPGIRLSTM